MPVGCVCGLEKLDSKITIFCYIVLVYDAVGAKKGVHLVQINISTRHGHISEETQDKITEKLEKLPRIYDRITAIELTMDLEHSDMLRVDLKVSAKHKPDFLASSVSDNLLGLIDQVVEKMEQQLRKHKGKAQDRHRGAGHRKEELAGDIKQKNENTAIFAPFKPVESGFEAACPTAAGLTNMGEYVHEVCRLCVS